MEMTIHLGPLIGMVITLGQLVELPTTPVLCLVSRGTLNGLALPGHSVLNSSLNKVQESVGRRTRATDQLERRKQKKTKRSAHGKKKKSSLNGLAYGAWELETYESIT